MNELLLIAAAREANEEKVRYFLAGDVNVNRRESRTGLTALHYAAARDCIGIVKLLINTNQCDYSQQDSVGRTAASLAFEVADNPVLGRYLYDLQWQQLNGRPIVAQDAEIDQIAPVLPSKLE